MTGERERRLITLAALFGLLVWALRVAPLPSLPSPVAHDGEPPRAELARDIEVYELSVLDGSEYSIQVFRDVQRICRDHDADATIAQACAIFDSAVHRDSDRHAIYNAVQLLRDG